MKFGNYTSVFRWSCGLAVQCPFYKSMKLKKQRSCNRKDTKTSKRHELRPKGLKKQLKIINVQYFWKRFIYEKFDLEYNQGFRPCFRKQFHFSSSPQWSQFKFKFNGFLTKKTSFVLMHNRFTFFTGSLQQRPYYKSSANNRLSMVLYRFTVYWVQLPRMWVFVITCRKSNQKIDLAT